MNRIVKRCFFSIPPMTDSFPIASKQPRARFPVCAQQQEKPCTLNPSGVPRGYSLLLWFVPPLLCFLWLWFLPPHALDVALSHAFFSEGRWWGSTQTWVEPLTHQAPKYVSILIACVFAFDLGARIVRPLRAGESEQARNNAVRREIYLLISMAACVIAVTLLKNCTGVFCPIRTTEFGGMHDIKAAASGFVWSGTPGNCWPSGAAGSGFCLLGLYFYWRDRSVRLARLVLAFALFSGLLAGFGRVSTGMHFASHVLAALCLDWLIAASVYVMIFDRAHIGKRLMLELRGRWVERTAEGDVLAGGPLLSTVACIVFTAGWWTLVYDAPMYARLVGLPEPLTGAKLALFVGSASAFGLLAAALLVILSCLPAKIFRSMLLALSTLGALGFAGAYLYGIAYTADMIRNFIATDMHEAMGYVSVRSLAVFLIVWLPLLWCGLVFERESEEARLRVSCSHKAVAMRVLKRFSLVAVLIVGALSMVLVNFQGFSGAMRADKSLRYQIVPVIMVYSLLRTLTADASPDGGHERLVIDPEPRRTIKPIRPTLFVVVVGETTRSANWQLAGYKRQTNPLLSARSLVNLPFVAACGTSTDVSVPCMMSRIGRSDYQRERILKEEALPGLLQRAGLNVLWIDNQSGCKGVCAGVPSRGPKETIKKQSTACRHGECLDGVFVEEVKTELESLAEGEARVLFLHMMGSHGPAYHQRSPEDEKQWLPECKANDLGSCSKEELTNAYDNSVRYTDRVLAEIIDALEAADQVDTGMIFVSDHGESLGEKGLYLHGAPYWMAPDEQLTVPGVIWISDGFARDYAVDRMALAAAVDKKVTHEHLYHTVLGLLRIDSSTKRDAFDLTRR